MSLELDASIFCAMICPSDGVLGWQKVGKKSMVQKVETIRCRTMPRMISYCLKAKRSHMC